MNKLQSRGVAMDLGKIEVERRNASSAANWFHHDQVYHNEYGLVWHNGKCIFLSSLQFQRNQNDPKSLTPPRILGQFDDDVFGVCWSQDRGRRPSFAHLCVQHEEYVSMWTVSGMYSSIKCHKQGEHKVKSISQGCLWHPSRPMLCVISHTELHLYNTVSATWNTLQLDGNVTAGCWVRDGSKFILALGSEIQVLMFNPDTQLLEPSVSCKSHTIQRVQPHTSIKAMVAVSNELVAIATDLPLDHLIYQSQQNDNTTDGKADIAPMGNDSEDFTAVRFPLIIPNDRIMPNPIAEMFKTDHYATGIDTSSLVGNSLLNDTAPAMKDEQASVGGTLECKLDQILNLTKEMDGLPSANKSFQNPEKYISSLRSQVEVSLADTSRSGPVDVTALINAKSDSANGSLKYKQDNVSDTKTRTLGKVVQFKECPSPASTNPEILSHRREQRTLKDLGLVSDGNDTKDFEQDIVNRTCGLKTKICSPEEVTRFLEDKLKERQRGAVDVTELLSSRSTGGYSDQDIEEQSEVLDGDNYMNEKLEAEKLGGDGRDEESRDVIDLTGLKADKIEGSVSQILQCKQGKPDSTNDAAKLSLINVSEISDYTTVALVDLPGILTPDLLHYQESTKSVVVGTNAQKKLQVYRLQDNKLEPCEQNIVLPDSHRPLGVCGIPGSLPGVLVLAGKSHQSDTEGAFLSFTTKVEMDLKLLTYSLPMEFVLNNVELFHTIDAYNYRWMFGQLPKTFRVSFDVKAKNDVHIGLSPENKDSDHMYEIVIGGWANTKSVIRRSKQGHPLTTSDTQSILDPMEFTTFIIDWDGSTLQVIKDGCQSPFLVYIDDTPLDVRFIGFSTGWGSEGDFVFKNLVPFSSIQDQNISEIPQPVVSSKTSDEQMHKSDETLPRRTVCPFPSTSRASSRMQGSRKFLHKPGGHRPWQSNKGSSGRSSEVKYPCPENADLLHLLCEGRTTDAGLSKMFLLTHQMLKLQDVKEAFGLSFVEMKIGDTWVVLTEDINGYIPLCFKPNTSHTIRGKGMNEDK